MEFEAGESGISEAASASSAKLAGNNSKIDEKVFLPCRKKITLPSWPPNRWIHQGVKRIQKISLRRIFFLPIFNQMVEHHSRLLDKTFAALADPTRRRILAQLAQGDECVTDLARPHAMSLAAVSKHLIVLEKAGLVKRSRQGRVHSLALEAKPMREAREWIDRYRKFWEGNLDQFEKYLNKLQTKETKKDDHR
jgi:DNA-binding transcriptional ArsR family regulator